jgi:sphingomyelin phosphodiesterase acid-like 3
MGTVKVKASSLQWLASGLFVVCSAGGGYGVAQSASAGVSPAKTIAVKSADLHSSKISALMLSDVHLDPFYDPAKVKRLVDAPVSEWEEILGGPDSPHQAQDYKALQRTCRAKGPDTSNALLQSSLRAIKVRASDARFVTLSGDLIAHDFTCRFATVVPGKTARDYTAFVEKTIAYVMGEIRKAEPDVPVYAALGNNDSGCADYRMDMDSAFLTAAGESMLRGLPPSAERDKALTDFAVGGYYSVAMAAPMRRTRMIVLNDLFMSRNYETCGGKAYPAAAATEIAWLKKELDAARQQGQRVWVMGHIPPGVDIYGMARKMRDVCDSSHAEMFLSSGEMADVLIANADVVKLGIFAHTHMDELRLLQPDGGAKKATEMIAVKMVPSITPVHGNMPAFVVAEVDPASATLMDYTVFDASNATGIDATWSKEYSYSQAYHEPAFAPLQLERLLTEFKDDPEAKTAASQAFIHYFYAGDNSGLIKPLWPEYVCALGHMTGKGFSDCACAAGR